jgi:hypothetical protein
LAKARSGKRKAIEIKDSGEETEREPEGSNQKVSYVFSLQNLVTNLREKTDKIKTRLWTDNATLRTVCTGGMGTQMPALCIEEGWVQLDQHEMEGREERG